MQPSVAFSICNSRLSFNTNVLVHFCQTRTEEWDRERESLRKEAASVKQHQDSEAMSTSTMSRAEEHGRMADVEATFEDRYAKLKLVAIKLKKKTLEQDKRIKELEVGGRDYHWYHRRVRS